MTDIDTINLKKNDFIFLFDVIEHIENDVDFIKNLLQHSQLSKECLIFITVPSYNCLFTSHDVFIKHYRRYNSKMLKDVANKCKLELVNNGTFFFLLLFPRIIKVITEKITKGSKNEGIGSWKSKGFLTKFIVFVLYLDYLILKTFRLVGINLPGLSNYMICKKSV